MHPNDTCNLYRNLGFDKYGKKTFSVAELIKCVLISKNIDLVVSSVRADADASRGRAEVLNGQARILVPPEANPLVGDYVELHGEWFEIKSIFPRRSLFGKLDHWQIDCRPGKALSWAV